VVVNSDVTDITSKNGVKVLFNDIIEVVITNEEISNIDDREWGTVYAPEPVESFCYGKLQKIFQVRRSDIAA